MEVRGAWYLHPPCMAYKQYNENHKAVINLSFVNNVATFSIFIYHMYKM